PKGTTGRKQLTLEYRVRIRTLFNDAHMTKKEIEERTGFSADHIRHTIRNPETAEKWARGRPRKLSPQQE
ncbi:hypothetical protein QBC38DRAFT_347787, partial [Podospora fimiseda]